MNAHTFTPDRSHLLAIALMVMIAVIGIGWAPQYLAWVLIFPLAWMYWVLKARTIVSEEGLDIQYAFRGNRSLSWEQFAGIGFKGARAFARTNTGEEINLPGITFNSLPRLSQASRGRIPDALSAGQAAANEKVVVIHRDGQQVLLTQEEYARHQQQLAESPSATQPDTPPRRRA
ncbi:PH domain-containing protein [Corynebacterium lizhenjunii]|uniref:PH domain-containing protein n=1 Tax=Corynebacterium lizhenjunii TaxID=2709394 RepID=A0A7T0KFX2_9CORY|nr:PH domain-containing protein [Corynebacterium lizhenjunii]QPK80048.1 PH domain-containing protein [Corynebacterium lizhenjunii]